MKGFVHIHGGILGTGFNISYLEMTKEQVSHFLSSCLFYGNRGSVHGRGHLEQTLYIQHVSAQQTVLCYCRPFKFDQQRKPHYSIDPRSFQVNDKDKHQQKMGVKTFSNFLKHQRLSSWPILGYF